MAKILIVSAFFHPQNWPRAFRTTELALELKRQGNEVTVITPFNKDYHQEFSKQSGINIVDLGTPKFKPIQLGSSKIWGLPSRVIRRLLQLLLAYPSIEYLFNVNRALKQFNNFDILISIAAPHSVHWGVASIWSKNSTKNPAAIWIADCGDPYCLQENDSFKTPFYFRYIEKWFCRKADFLTVPTKGAINGYFKEFHHKIKVIPQGFRFEDSPINPEINNKPYPVFGYGGGFIPGRRDPKEFIEYLAKQQDEFRFIIYSNSLDYVRTFIPMKDQRFELRKPVTRKEFLYEASSFDFLVNFENVGDKQMPSKLIDYAIIGRPILSIKTGALNVGVVKEFLEGDFSNTLVIENPDQYRIENVARKFVELSKIIGKYTVSSNPY